MPSTELTLDTSHTSPASSAKTSPTGSIGVINSQKMEVKTTSSGQKVTQGQAQESNGHANGFQEEVTKWSFREESVVSSCETTSINHVYQSQDGDSATGIDALKTQTVDMMSDKTTSVPANVTEVMPAVKMDHPSLQWKKSGMEYLDGPDQVLPSEAICTWHPEGAVKIQFGEGEAKRRPVSVPTYLERAASRGPNVTAMAVQRDSVWVKWTYDRYLKDVRTCAKAFIHLGLERFHSVCIIGFNSPEWFISDMAAIYAGGFAAGIYTTNTAEACFHCAENSQANIVVVEDEKQLEKILEVRSRLPHLKAVVQYSGTPKVDGVLSWSQLMFLGSQQDDSILDDRLKRISVNQCCTLIYTSGTTGLPKGVMLTHDNLTWITNSAIPQVRGKEKSEVVISYLPLSHVAAQMIDLYLALGLCGTVYFAGKDALKGGLAATLRDVRPTIFLGVPRVWEKIHEKMMEVGRQTKGIKRAIANWAKAKGLEHNKRRMQGDKCAPFGFGLAHALVFRKVRAALGMDRCKYLATGAAPIARELLDYFSSLNMPLMEVYGMSESCGPHTLSRDDAFLFGSVGLVLPGMETRMEGGSGSDDQGEICMRGRHIFAGYLRSEEKTMETLDTDGWLHSGDVGRLDQEGFLHITGRIKEIIITAGGENIPPTIIEDNVKAQLPCISNAMLIGDKKKFLTMLLTLKSDVDLESGDPLDTLTEATKEWCRSVGSQAARVADIVTGKDQKVYNAIQEGISQANKLATSNAQRVQKWAILPKDFSIPGGELGPTMKLKRFYTVEKYTDIIESFYVGA